MTIYNINFGIGWASSGVEYAQSYRAQLLRSAKQPMKFIFLDFIQNENIQTLTANLNFKDKEIIWLYQHFTDIKIAPSQVTIEEIKKTINANIIKVETGVKIRRIYYKNEQSFVTCYMKDENKDIVDRAEFVSEGMLIRKDFYSYVCFLSEYYAPHDNKAKAYMRQFYNEDGSTAYEEYLGERDDDSVYMIDGTILYGKRAFVGHFLKSLKLTNEDILIVDRATHIGQVVLENKGEAKVGVVVHAEHYSKHATNQDHILWNNFYEYQFNQCDEIDFFITATDRQNEVLASQFKNYQNKSPKIVTIPVGALDKLIKPRAKRKPYSVITASRLANEKHVDWLVKAVAKAKQHIPELTFDIYGEGGEKAKIAKTIEEYEAESYISLKGHVHLNDIYRNYELFLSASQSEGFGLTLMEAVGSGLGMIGFDVDYGNTTFINDGENGYLIPININEESVERITDDIAEKIVQFFKQDLKAVQKASYTIAEPYKKRFVKQRWIDLIEEVRHD